MGNTIIDEVQLFYEDPLIYQPLNTVFKTNHVWDHSNTQNDMLWSYAKNNRVVSFMRVVDGTGVNACCLLRDAIVSPPPMCKHEYF
jgi:hypothetical protein